MTPQITWTEIPVHDLNRAKTFYQSIIDTSFTDIQIAEFDYAILGSESKQATLALVKGYGYEPSRHGVTVYLNASPDMNPILQMVEDAGGRIVLDKTFLSPEAGYIAFIIDSEGNKIGLQHS